MLACSTVDLTAHHEIPKWRREVQEELVLGSFEQIQSITADLGNLVETLSASSRHEDFRNLWETLHQLEFSWKVGQGDFSHRETELLRNQIDAVLCSLAKRLSILPNGQSAAHLLEKTKSTHCAVTPTRTAPVTC